MAKVNKNFELANDSLTSSTLSNEKGIEVVKNVSDFYKAVPVTTSVNVAEIFGKTHGNVLRDINNLDCSEEFRKINFEKMFSITELPNGGCRKDPYYNITRDGFTFLVMGYRGKKAAIFKEAYIKAFNQMEQELNKWRQTRLKAKAIRRSLTDSIKNNLDTNKPFVYSNYTKLSVKKAFGKNIDQIRKEKNVSKSENVRNHMNIQEIERLDYFEHKIAGMVDTLKILGMSDHEIYSKIRDANIK